MLCELNLAGQLLIQCCMNLHHWVNEINQDLDNQKLIIGKKETFLKLQKKLSQLWSHGYWSQGFFKKIDDPGF